jgi:small basic protein (TIGR04137 family)
MSIHKSLVSAGKLRKHRNVLTRAERLEILKREGRWKEEQSIFNLPKVRNIMMKAKKKVKEEAEAVPAEGAAAPAEGAAAAAGAAPAAAGAKGAAPAGKGAAPAAKGAAPAAGAKGAAPAKKEEKKK